MLEITINPSTIPTIIPNSPITIGIAGFQYPNIIEAMRINIIIITPTVPKGAAVTPVITPVSRVKNVVFVPENRPTRENTKSVVLNPE